MLYEIKAKNAQYASIAKWPLKITTNTYQVYRDSFKFGFNPKAATVLFIDDWKFDIRVQDFERARRAIDKPKKNDKK